MYGNHHSSHPNGYQNSELGSSSYPYFTPSNLHHHHHHLHMHQQQNAFSVAYAAQVLPNNPSTIMTHSHSTSQNQVYTQNSALSHLYSPSAIEYGIHTTPSTNNSPNEQYYENEGGYYAQSTTGMNGTTNNVDGGSPSETHIISTDNGLSYTNLDYVAYQQAQQQNQQFSQANEDKSSIQHQFSDEIEASSGQNINFHSSLVSWQSGHGYAALDNSDTSSNQMIINNNSIQSPPINRLGNSGTVPIQQMSPNSLTSHQKQQTSQNVPQYKWMQVKRNMPKPQCKLLELHFSLFSSTSFMKMLGQKTKMNIE